MAELEEVKKKEAPEAENVELITKKKILKLKIQIGLFLLIFLSNNYGDAYYK